MSTLFAPLAAKLRAHVPTREWVEGNPFLRPVAHLVLRSELWRMNRRAVPRAIALGLFLGVTIPVAHSVIAALLAVFIGANVPVAFATTWVISNPVTWLVIYPVAYHIGRFLMQLEVFAPLHPMAPALSEHAAGLGAGRHGSHHHHMLHRIADLGMTLAFGMIVEATVLAVLGYGLSTLAWRWWIARKWRRRHVRRRPMPTTAPVAVE